VNRMMHTPCLLLDVAEQASLSMAHVPLLSRLLIQPYAPVAWLFRQVCFQVRPWVAVNCMGYRGGYGCASVGPWPGCQDLAMTLKGWSWYRSSVLWHP
jgi:hypothetical protein